MTDHRKNLVCGYSWHVVVARVFLMLLFSFILFSFPLPFFSFFPLPPIHWRCRDYIVELSVSPYFSISCLYGILHQLTQFNQIWQAQRSQIYSISATSMKIAGIAEEKKWPLQGKVRITTCIRYSKICMGRQLWHINQRVTRPLWCCHSPNPLSFSHLCV